MDLGSPSWCQIKDMPRPFAALLAIVAVFQSAEAPRGVPLLDVEACQIEFAFPPGAMNSASSVKA